MHNLVTNIKDQPSPYDPTRDIRRLVEYINASPEKRVGKGTAFALASIQLTRSSSITASTLRRSFATYAATHPGAELGLGIQLGHASLRMTSGYITESQQQVTKMIDDTRAVAVRTTVASLMKGTDALTGTGGRGVAELRSQIVTDPLREASLQRQAGKNYHLGIVNDCFYRPNLAACGEDGPQLAGSFCASYDCTNAVFHKEHRQQLVLQIERIDLLLTRPKLSPPLEKNLRLKRTSLIALLVELDTQPSHQPTEEF